MQGNGGAFSLTLFGISHKLIFSLLFFEACIKAWNSHVKASDFDEWKFSWNFFKTFSFILFLFWPEIGGGVPLVGGFVPLADGFTFKP